MNQRNHFAEMKIETAQLILGLEDEAILAKVRAILWDSATTEADLEAIHRSREACERGEFTDADEFLKEIKHL